MDWACPNLFFSKCPFDAAGTLAHNRHIMAHNGGEEGMYNRVEELLKGGQR
jgi:hypothetical protein